MSYFTGRAAGQTENRDTFVGSISLALSASFTASVYYINIVFTNYAIIVFILVFSFFSKVWEKRRKKNLEKQSPRFSYHWGHHDTTGLWLTIPQAIFSEDTCQPPATETTHAACQRVQEPHATGRHQCV